MVDTVLSSAVRVAHSCGEAGRARLEAISLEVVGFERR
jgi:hypothetical protein